MNFKIGQLCFTYDEAQKASRDPSRCEKQNDFLNILFEKRKEIVLEVEMLMHHFHDRFYANYVNDTSEFVAKLTYFNTWFALRGGWASNG
jgi:hypothetical protein